MFLSHVSLHSLPMVPHENVNTASLGFCPPARLPQHDVRQAWLKGCEVRRDVVHASKEGIHQAVSSDDLAVISVL